MKAIRGRNLALVMWLLACGWAIGAEPFEDALREAVKEYRAGNFDKARDGLAKASEILEKARSDRVSDTFPDPPQGWRAGEVEKADIPPVLGGGRSVKRLYAEKEGSKEILLEVIYDSSLVTLMTGLLANDAVAESQGFKVRRIGTARGLFKETDGGGELTIPASDGILVKFTGKGGAGERDLIHLARETDHRSLRKD